MSSIQKVNEGDTGATASNKIYASDVFNLNNASMLAALGQQYSWHADGAPVIRKDGNFLLNDDTDGQYELTVTLPTDVTGSPRCLLNIGELLLTVDGGNLVLYHKPSGGGASGSLSGAAAAYAGQKVFIVLLRTLAGFAVSFNGNHIGDIGNIEHLADATTVYLASYQGTALFTPIEIFSFATKDNNGNVLASINFDNQPDEVISAPVYLYGEPFDANEIRESEATFNGSTSLITIGAANVTAAGDINETYVFDVDIPAGPFPVKLLYSTLAGSLQIYLNGSYLGVVNQGVTEMYRFDMSSWYDKRARITVVRKPTEFNAYANGAALTRTTAGGYNTLIGASVATIGGPGATGWSNSLFNFFKVNAALTPTQVQNIEKDLIGEADSAYVFLRNDKMAANKWEDIKGNAEVDLQNITVLYPAFIYGGAEEPVSNYLKTVPATIYVTANVEANIYWDNCIKNFTGHFNAEFEIAGAEVRSMDKGLRIKYTAPGTYTGTLRLFNTHGALLESKTVTIKAYAPNLGSGVKQFLITGDSTIDDALMISPGVPYYDHEGPAICKRIWDFTNANAGFTPRFIGHKRDYPPYYHAGMSGWSSASMLNADSPFWHSGAIDFGWYVSTNAATISGATNTIDFMIYQIGINDLKQDSIPAETVVANVKTFVNLFLTVYPTAKVIIGMPGSGDNMDGFSVHFFGNSSYNTFTTKMLRLQELYITEFDNGAFNANVFLCNAGQWIDRFYGYPNKLINVNAQSTQQTLQMWDSVHPNESGYNQMADAYIGRIKSLT